MFTKIQYYGLLLKIVRFFCKINMRCVDNRKDIPKYLVISKTFCIFALVMRLWRNW